MNLDVRFQPTGAVVAGIVVPLLSWPHPLEGMVKQLRSTELRLTFTRHFRRHVMVEAVRTGVVVTDPPANEVIDRNRLCLIHDIAAKAMEVVVEEEESLLVPSIIPKNLILPRYMRKSRCCVNSYGKKPIRTRPATVAITRMKTEQMKNMMNTVEDIV